MEPPDMAVIDLQSYFEECFCISLESSDSLQIVFFKNPCNFVCPASRSICCLEGSDRASSKGYIVRWVEAPSNKLLTTAFEASLESVTVTCRLSVDSKIAGIAMEHRNPKVSEGRHRGQGGRQYMHLSLW
jgi:hypothetical protein